MGAKPRTTTSIKPDDSEQPERFVRSAIERGADRMSSPADKLIGKLAKYPPEPRRCKAKDQP
jgi:hypothetical protein